MLAALVVVGGLAAAVLLLGTPELAPPSEWSDARARIADGTYPPGYVVDIAFALMLLAWIASVWFMVRGVRKQTDSAHDETVASTAGNDSTGDEETGEPWYRQGPPIFDEQFSDDYPRVVVPPEDMVPEDGPQDSLWQPAAESGEPFGTVPPDSLTDDTVSDAEIIGGARSTDADEPPMIVPVRAYYFTRPEDTLRSISAQFLQTPRRWQELRSLNAASPGVAAVGPDTLLPEGTALALPGDPLPWGKPDPVYLWTLAEKFLFTAWGREPTPEEVVPFWRGLTSGTQLEAGTPPVQPGYLAPPAAAPEAAPETAALHTEPPLPPVESALTVPQTPPPATPPTHEPAAPPPTDLPPPTYQSPVPPTHEPAQPAAYQPSTTYESPGGRSYRARRRRRDLP